MIKKCIKCGEMKLHSAKGLCIKCYRKQHYKLYEKNAETLDKQTVNRKARVIKDRNKFYERYGI